MHNYVLRVSSVGKFGSAEAIFCPLEFRKNWQVCILERIQLQSQNMQKLFSTPQSAICHLTLKDPWRNKYVFVH